jgi:hypothetical protein
MALQGGPFIAYTGATFVAHMANTTEAVPTPTAVADWPGPT